MPNPATPSPAARRARPMRRLALALAFLPLLAAVGCEDDLLEPESRGSIEGQVLDFESREPLAGVGITTSPPTNALVSDAEGNFRIADLPTGNYTLAARLSGYRANSTTVSVRDGETTQAVLFLEEEAAGGGTPEEPDFEASVLGFSNRFRGDSSFAVVEYRARNAGDVNVSAYEVYFQILTTGRTYFQEVSGTDLRVGQADIGEFEKYVGTDTVTAVQISGTFFEGE